MSDSAEMKPYLVRLSELFKDEGDNETAQALLGQLESRPLDGFSEADAAEVESLIEQANKASTLGDYERARDLYVTVLAMREEALGPDHLDTLYSMNDLARCMLNSRDSDDAETMYTRLLRIAITSLGQDDTLTRTTRDNIAVCKNATRLAWGFWTLEEHIKHMFRESSITRQLHQSARIDRLHAVAFKLESRGQYGRALPVFEAWISARLPGAHPDDDDAVHDIAHYARFLAKAGETARSQKTYRQIVAIRSRQHCLGKGAQALRHALTDWAQSMENIGDHALARTTLELASRII